MYDIYNIFYSLHAFEHVENENFSIILAQADKVANKDAYFEINFCFYIEFHRMAAVINCCELKKLKIFKDEFCHIYVIMLYVITTLFPMA